MTTVRSLLMHGFEDYLRGKSLQTKGPFFQNPSKQAILPHYFDFTGSFQQNRERSSLAKTKLPEYAGEPMSHRQFAPANAH